MNIEKFVTGGKAIFTLESKKTGKYYTFKAVAMPRRPGAFWIFHEVNEESFYMGSVIDGSFRLTQKSPKENRVTKVLDWFYRLVREHKNAPDLVFRHAGKCAACGRKLTTPESLESGFGPVCGGRA